MEDNPLRKEIETAIGEYWMSIQSLDSTRYGSNFAPGSTLEDPVGAEPIHGPENIAAFFGGGLQALGLTKIIPNIKDMFVGVGQSTEVAVRWELTVMAANGRQAIVQGIGIFKFAAIRSGPLRLESVREFYDPFEFASQLQQA